MFKLRRASPTGGGLAKEVTYIHRPILADSNANVNVISYANGVVGQVPTKILLDTGADVSVLRYESLP